MQKLDYIDALRGWAILGILIVHCSQFGHNDYSVSIQYLMMNGAHGVQLFYIISAFTLFMSLASNVEGKKRSNYYFWTRRYFRIAPMYYIGIIYYLSQNRIILDIETTTVAKAAKWDIIANIIFIHGFSPFWMNSVVPGGWTIAVEVQFYCLLPLLYKRIKTLNQAVKLLIMAILFNSLLSIVESKFHILPTDPIYSNFLYYYLPNQFPVFVCGIIMYFLIKTPKSELRIEIWALLTLNILFLLDLSSGKRVLFSDTLIYSLAFILLGFILSKKEYKFLVNSFIRYLGKISYSVYIVHIAILYWLNKWDFLNFLPSSTKYLNTVNYCLRFLLLLLISILLSAFFYNFVEIPFQKVGKFIIGLYSKKRNQEEYVM